MPLITIRVAYVLNPQQAADLHTIAESLHAIADSQHGIDESLSAILAHLDAEPIIVGEIEAGPPVEQVPAAGNTPIQGA